MNFAITIMNVKQIRPMRKNPRVHVSAIQDTNCAGELRRLKR